MAPLKSLRQIILEQSLPSLMKLVLPSALALILVAFLLVQKDIEYRHSQRVDIVQEVYRQAINEELNRLTEVAQDNFVIDALTDTGTMSKFFLRNFLKAQPTNNRDNDSIQVFDRRGNLIAANKELSVPQDVKQMPWLNPVLVNQQTFQRTEVGAVTFAVPIVHDGETLGALIARYENLEPFLSFHFEESIVLITNPEQRIIYSSDPDSFQIASNLNWDDVVGWRRAYQTEIDNLSFWGVEPQILFYREFVKLIGFALFAILFVIISSYSSAKVASRLTTAKLNNFLTTLESYRKNRIYNSDALDIPAIEFDQLNQEFSFLMNRLDESTHSNERVLALINSLNDLLVVFDLEGNLNLSNRAFESFLAKAGLKKDDLLQTLFFGIEPGKLLDGTQFFESVEKHYLLSPQYSDTNYAVINWTRHKQVNDFGEVIGLIFVGLDNTRSSELQTELHLKEAAVDGAESGIVILETSQSAEPVFIYANKGIEKITGIAQEDFLGGIAKILSHPMTDPSIFERIAEATHNRKPIVEILERKLPDGTAFHLELALSPVILPEEDTKQYYLGVVKDVTEQQEMSSLLVEAKRRAEESAQMKSSFLASMSHEIRTPLNGIIGMLDILKESPLDEQQLSQLNIAQNSSESLLSIINDILDFSKVEAGKMTLESIDFDIRDMLNGFIDSMAHQAHSKNLELILDADGINRQFVKGDPGRLRQIITNLVGNAIKFTPAGEVIVHASLAESIDSKLHLNVKVSDTGIGIPHEKQAHLFEPFTQVDGSHRREQQGTGLGLAIVKQLCEAMNGHIWLSSEVGNGSVFGFRVELDKSDKQAIPLPVLSTHNKHVVVVDDNASNLIVLGKQLRQWGVSVTTFSDPKEALNYFTGDANPVDAAILDLNMPELGGAELCRSIKGIERHKTLKMILMTSISQRGDAQYYADVGFSGYFPKPATSSDIIDALTILFDDGEALSKASPLVTQHYVRSLRQEQELDQSYRILLVEDNPVNQMISKKYILSLGLEATVAQDGQAALEILKQQSESSFDLILMDCQMPVMDGFEATRKIRLGEAGDQHVHTPIIAMTANAMKGDREHCLEVGMDDYLSKPIRKDVFAKTVKNWLTRN